MLWSHCQRPGWPLQSLEPDSKAGGSASGGPRTGSRATRTASTMGLEGPAMLRRGWCWWGLQGTVWAGQGPGRGLVWTVWASEAGAML